MVEFPQGVLFNLYMVPLDQMIQNNEITHYNFADETHLTNVGKCTKQTVDCVEVLWLKNRHN